MDYELSHKEVIIVDYYNELLKRRPWIRNYDPDVPYEVRYPRIPIHYMLRHQADCNPDRAAIWFYGNEITYWELNLTAVRFANALLDLGVKKGDRVGLMLPNCPQFVIAFYALVSIGAIVTNVNPIYTPSELEAIISTTDMSAIISIDGAIPTIKAVTERVDIPTVIITTVADYMPGTEISNSQSLGLKQGWYHFSELLLQTTSTVRPRIDIDIDKDPAIIQFTGGTTGVPKGAVLSHNGVVAAIYAMKNWWNTMLASIPLERRSVLCLVPYCHIYGEFCAMSFGIVNGATQIMLPRFDINEVMDTLAKFEEIMYFPAVATMLQAMFNHPRTEELNLAKRIISIGMGGVPCPPQLEKRLWELGVRCTDGYGLTEVAGQATGGCTGMNKLHSVGLPYPSMDVKIMDNKTGQQLVAGEIGEVVIKCPWTMMGYWNNQEATAQQIRDEWVYTGDLGYFDEDGFLFLVDRSKDLIISSGYNIYPVEVDSVIVSHPKVVDAMCIGTPHEFRGETLKAFVVLAPGETATEEEIIAYCREKLTAYKVPKLVEFRDSVPRSPIGKPFRRILRDEEISKMSANK